MGKKSGHPFHFLVYLAILSIVGFLSTDMYLPAFDTMREDFGSSKGLISYSLSFFLGGFAIAQLMWGPISDRIGKPKAILAGMTLFAVTSIGIYFTHHVYLFLVLRVVQAIGACAATVSWQALVIERYPERETGKVFSSIMPLVALSPALAPLLGAFLLEQWGWRSIFVVLTITAVLLILYTFTIGKDPVLEAENSNENKSYFTFFTSKKYIGNVMIYSFCSGAFFAWLTGAPFFLKELGYSEMEIGWSFVPQTIAFMIGGYGLRLFQEKMNDDKVLPILLFVFSISMIAMPFVGMLENLTLTILLVPFCLMAFANGATYPIVVNKALKVFPKNSGKSSAMQNTLQLGICFLSSGIVSFFSAHALMATMIVMAVCVPFVWIGFQLSKK